MSESKPTYPVGTIARLLLMSERRVQQLTKEGVIPKADRGRYELAPAVQGYIRYLQDRNLKVDGNTLIDVNAERARKIRAEADIAELEAAKKRGETATIKQVQRTVENAFAEVRAHMRNIPNRIVTQIIGESDESLMKGKILSEIDNALLSISDGFDLLEDDDDQSSEI
jgi:phage terminase Nu1 subunit (DNA packaging protein)